MTTPDWLKPGLYGAAAGAAALALTGFTALGWTAAGDAARMADAQAQAAVVAALAPICIEQAARDASEGAGAALDGVKAASSWQRRDLVIAAGWATMPGAAAAAADREVAAACGDALVAAP